MDEKEHPNNSKEAEVERSTEDIRQDIAKEKENISQTVEKISERIEEKLDWREYVKNAPYWTIGAAAGLGFLASRMLITRTTPTERIVGAVVEEVRGSLSGLLGKAADPGFIKVTLQVIATKAVANLIKKAISTSVENSGAGPRSQTGRDSTVSSKADASKMI